MEPVTKEELDSICVELTRLQLIEAAAREWWNSKPGMDRAIAASMIGTSIGHKTLWTRK